MTPTAANPTLLSGGCHSLAYRSYYAFSRGEKGGLRTSTGIPTRATFGFITLLIEEVMETQRPDDAAVAFDLPKPAFRHKADRSYPSS